VVRDAGLRVLPASAIGLHSRPVAALVGEDAPQALVGLLYAGDFVYEVQVPGGPPERAVSDWAQADVLLHPYRVANRVVLDGTQVIGEMGIV
jgi:hypothetical protein